MSTKRVFFQLINELPEEIWNLKVTEIDYG